MTPRPSRVVDATPVRPHAATLHEALELAARDGAELFLAGSDAEPTAFGLARIREGAERVAQNLLATGLERGERVLVMLPTSEAWLTAFYGTLLAGGVAVPLGPTFSFGGISRYAETVRHVAIDAGARHLIGNAHVAPHIATLREGGSPLRHFLRPEDLCDAPATRRPLPTPCASDTAILQYTSGTTGSPKGVILSHRALLANAQMIGARTAMHAGDVGVSWLPLFHDMGLVGGLLTALAFRFPLLLMPPEAFLMQPRRWLQWISRRRATLSVAPNFAYQLVADRMSDRHVDELDLSAWRCAFDGAEPVRPATLRAFEGRFSRAGLASTTLSPVYGMAENALAATFPRRGARWTCRTLGDASSSMTASVGTPLDGVSIEIVDGSGRVVPEGQVGEIRLRSPSLMDGYFRDDTATARVLRDGALLTGDLGAVHAGELYVSGRAKELIIKRGTNHHPEDLERTAAAAGGPSVLRAAAFGCADEQSGTERIVLVLETQPIAASERDALTRSVNGALIAALGISADVTLIVPPRTIERTTSGKLRRTALRERYLGGTLGEAAR